MKKEKANKLKCTQIDQLSYNSSFKNSRAKKVVARTSKFRGIEAIRMSRQNVIIQTRAKNLCQSFVGQLF